MLRISPSLAQSYANYMAYDWMTEQKLIDAITKKFKGNAATDLGTAFHEMLEYHVVNPNKKIVPVGFHDNGNVLFNEDTEEYVRAYRELDPLVEVWNTKYVQLGKYEVQINMRCDGMKGLDLLEIKTTSGSIDYSNYYPSLQWMIYLWAYKANSITYFVYKLGYPRGSTICEIRDHAEFKMVRPSNIEKLIDNNVMPNIIGLIDFCKQKGLMDWLEIKNAGKTKRG